MSMAYLAVADQGINHRSDDLGGDSKAHAGERTGGRNQEGIDSDYLAVSIHQRTTRVAGIDSRVGLNELSGLVRIIGIRIGTVQRAHNTASHGKAEPERIAESQHGLSGT